MRKRLMALIMATACVPADTVPGVMTTAQALSGAVVISDSYNEVTWIVKEKLDRFSKSDQTVLLAINFNLGEISEVIASWTSGTSARTITMKYSTMEILYTKAKENYLLGREIVLNNEEKFSVGDRLMLQSFDDNALALDKKMQLLKSKPKLASSAATIADIVSMSVTIGKILVPIIKEI